MDTRVIIYTLLDYKEFYGVDKSISDAEDLIKNIPTVTLLNYISEFGVNLYLHENSEQTGKVQFMLVRKLLNKSDASTKQKWASEIKRQANKGHTPIMFWNYSNLLFYGIIFKTLNNIPSRDLTGDEAKRVFDAYLIVNGIANDKIQIESEAIKKADEEEMIEDVIIPSFIYQKDYVSSVDFNNQVARGVSFFTYLENEPKYTTLIQEYYKNMNVSGYLRMFKNLMILFSEIKIGKDLDSRNQLANVQEYFIGKEVDLAYIETLCINSEIAIYSVDESFGTLRSKFLYRLNQYEFLILDVNFLIDQFYKAQVFSFNAFLKTKGIKAEFLSEKGKNFTENIYLPMVMNACFPNYVRFYGESCLNSVQEELCDVYLRDSNKICLIEFKDVLLNATIKNSADKEKLFAEFKKKFVANQTNKPKGITQLINAIRDIDTNSVYFDNSVPKGELEIYPTIVYTDSSFGIEGINKKFKEFFIIEIHKIKLKSIIVKDVTFINLNFFEIREDYFATQLLNLFQMLDSYHDHTRNPDYILTPFEIFSRFFMSKYVPEELEASSSFLKHLNNIVTAK